MRQAVHHEDNSSTILGHSKISVTHIKNLVEKWKSLSNREVTKANYLCIWQSFNKFVMKLDNPPDSWEEKTILFCVNLIEEGKKSATIKSYVSAIKSMLKLDG